MERLSKNFIWMALANITAGAFAATLFIYLARTLGPAPFGYLSYAQAFVIYLATFIDLGLTTYGIREVAKDRANVSGYVSEIVSFKFMVAAVLYMLALVIAAVFPHPGPLRVLLPLFSLTFFAYAFATEWAFQGIEKMHMVFISFAATSALQFALIYLFVKGPQSLPLVPVLYFIATLPVILTFPRILGFRLKIWTLDLKRIKAFLASSLVIWLIAVFAQVYNGLDVVMLGFFKRFDEVGYFTVARRAVGGAALLMIFLANAVLPRLSSTFDKDMTQFRMATRKFLKVGAALTVIVIIAFVLFTGSFISLTVGDEYRPADMPFKIMGISLILLLFNLPFSTGLIAAGMEKEVLKQAASSAALNVGSNIVLIPRFGMVGASVSFFLAEMLALIWILSVYRRRINPQLI